MKKIWILFVVLIVSLLLITSAAALTAGNNTKSKSDNAKKTTLKDIDPELKDAFNTCFNDIFACNCSSLPDKSFVDFCERQIGYADRCLTNGGHCEDIDQMPFMKSKAFVLFQPFVKDSIKEKVDCEKKRGWGIALAIGRKCVNNQDDCECEKVPEYARSFCDERKQLQNACVSEKEINACEKLNSMAEVMSPGVPAFIKKPLDSVLRSFLNKAREGAKKKQAKNLGETIFSCLSSPQDCNCSNVLVPYNDFCEAKKPIIQSCLLNDSFVSCCKMTKSEALPEDLTASSKISVKGKVESSIAQKKKDIYNRLRPAECTRMKLSYEKCCDFVYDRFNTTETANGTTIIVDAENDDKADVKVTGSSWDSRVEYSRNGTYGGDWYLSRENDAVYYKVSVPKEGTYALWLRDYDDGKHTFGERSVTIEVNKKAIGTFSENAQRAPWVWHKVADVTLKAGEAEIMIKKAATTEAAAMIDRFILSSDPAFAPR